MHCVCKCGDIVEAHESVFDMTASAPVPIAPAGRNHYSFHRIGRPPGFEEGIMSPRDLHAERSLSPAFADLHSPGLFAVLTGLTGPRTGC